MLITHCIQIILEVKAKFGPGQTWQLLYIHTTSRAVFIQIRMDFVARPKKLHTTTMSRQLSKLFKRRKHDSPRIPVELWIVILSQAIEVPFCFDATCTSDTFPAFSKQWQPLAPSDSYEKSERIRRKLSLVCRLWRDILGEQDTRWVRDSTIVGKRVHRMDILNPMHPPDTLRILVSALSNPSVQSTLVCLSISQADVLNESKWPFKDLLESGPQLTSLRSLRLHIATMEDSNFLNALEGAFPRLTSLAIRAGWFVGSLNYDKLEILELEVGVFELDSWSLPSLKHLSLVWGYNMAPFDQFISRLPSIQTLFCDVIAITIDSDFWTRFPNLECIVGQIPLQWDSDPPEGHPFHHWGVIPPSNPHPQIGDYLSYLRNEFIPRRPFVRRITFLEDYVKVCRRSGNLLRWRELGQTCGQYNVQVFDDNNDPIEFNKIDFPH